MALFNLKKAEMIMPFLIEKVMW